MAKFEALYGVTSLIVPFIERDEKGKIIRDQSIVFNQGMTLKDKVIPANYLTNDPDKIKYLKANGGNEANGGFSFKEIIVESKPAPAAKANPASVDAPKPKHAPAAAVVTELPALEDDFIFPDDLAESPSTGKTDYPEANTAQEASAVLRGLFPELTTRDTSSKAKIKAFIADKNITFSNLDL